MTVGTTFPTKLPLINLESMTKLVNQSIGHSIGVNPYISSLLVTEKATMKMDQSNDAIPWRSPDSPSHSETENEENDAASSSSSSSFLSSARSFSAPSLTSSSPSAEPNLIDTAKGGDAVEVTKLLVAGK